MNRCTFCGSTCNEGTVLLIEPKSKKPICLICKGRLDRIERICFPPKDMPEPDNGPEDIPFDGDPFEADRLRDDPPWNPMDELKKALRDPDTNGDEALQGSPEEPEPVPEKILPRDIVKILDEEIIGQHRAKKVLAVAVYNHGKRVNDKDVQAGKSNILMVGPSGSGKTFLARRLARIINVPFVIVDATSFTEAGFVGEDVENIIARLVTAADGDIKQAERGIVFIDEIDKIARKSTGRGTSKDVSGEGVQHALLKIIEGSDIILPSRRGIFSDGAEVHVNTENILFICAGAFEGLFDEPLEKGNRVGFTGTFTEAEKAEDTEAHRVTADGLVQYGMIPELMGRLPSIVQLEGLKEDDFVRILVEPKHSLVNEYKALLKQDNVELEFEDDALREIARTAVERHTGARGLRGIMEDLMMDIMYDAPTAEGTPGKCIITRDMVRAACHYGSPPYRNGNTNIA